MGDRVLVVFADSKDYSPAVYLHWGGSESPQLLEAAWPKLRRDDAFYSAARFCGHCCEDTGVELFAIPDFSEKPPTKKDWEKISHGDAGVLIVNVTDGIVQAYGGYLEPFQMDIEQIPK